MIFRKISLASVSAIFALTLGCNYSRNESSKDVVVEIYYRDFNKLWPVKFTESELIRSAPYSRIYGDERDIHDIRELLNEDSCNEGAAPPKALDVYLIAMEYSAGKLAKKWVASKFDLINLTDGKMCQLTIGQRQEIDYFIKRQEGKGVRAIRAKKQESKNQRTEENPGQSRLS